MPMTIARDNSILNDHGEVIGVLTQDCTEYDKRQIECGSELLPFTEDFVKESTDGKFRPKTYIKTFETILLKHKL